MANERHRRLMQEALDENLEPEALHELYTHLDASADDEVQFHRLKQVDRMLRNAPHERAPQRLAMNIMSRLAEAVNLEQMPRVSGLALALGLALAAAAMLPALIAAGWLLLSALGSAGLMAAAIQQIAGLLSLGVVLAEQAIASVQQLMATNTEIVLLLVAAVPTSLLWLLRYGPRARQQRIV